MIFRKAPSEQQIFVSPVGGASDIATIDPGLSTDINSIGAINLVFTGLVQLDRQGLVRPQLATHWSISPDGLTYTFCLKPYLKFNNGRPLTSQDVIYSVDRALDPILHSRAAPLYLGLIKDADKKQKGDIQSLIDRSLHAPDPNTVIITISKKATYFLQALTYPTSYVVEKRLIDKYGEQWTDHLDEGGGAGPFKLHSYQHGKQIVFVPNPYYYGAKPQLTKIVIPFYKERRMVYDAYLDDKVDFTGIPAALFLTERNNLDFHRVPQLWIEYLGMNYLIKPFHNIKIRQAFALAINKDMLAHTIFNDMVIPTNHIIPEGMPGYNSNLKGPDSTISTSGNPDLARQLLMEGMVEEGWDEMSQIPHIKLTFSSGTPALKRDMEAIIQAWKDILGISVEPQPMDLNRLIGEINATTNNPKGLMLWEFSWVADYLDPQNWTTLLFGEGSPANSVNYGQNFSQNAYRQQQIQRQLALADEMPLGDVRLQQYIQAEQQLVSDVAWIPLNQNVRFYRLKPYVHGYVINPQNLIPPDEWANIYISAH